MLRFDPREIPAVPFLFFTGKGGVGKTSVACASALRFAEGGERVLLISTDPASNLQDVFGTELDSTPAAVPGAPGLFAVNLDPAAAAESYRESVVAPLRGVLPESAVANIEEQLSGSCTLEIAAFTEFASYLSDTELLTRYDRILFDTAPTGHTLRLLELPSAWTDFIGSSEHGASCLGQLAGLESKKKIYETALKTLKDPAKTALILVARAAETPLYEAARASSELSALGIGAQRLVINGLLEKADDTASTVIQKSQEAALCAMPSALRVLPRTFLPLTSFDITGLAGLRALLDGTPPPGTAQRSVPPQLPGLQAAVKELLAGGTRLIFAMGKGGVGKTAVAASVAMSAAAERRKVLLATTDPAPHLSFVAEESPFLSVHAVNAAEELEKYRAEVLSKARASGLSGDDLAYIEEDLRSPCTTEIALFRAFAELVDKAGSEIVVIDTAPTGHTLLLLESVANYDREIRRTKGDTPECVARLLPRLKGPETAILIVTLPEATPVYEAVRLEEDLKRAGITSCRWVINRSFAAVPATNSILCARAEAEIPWIRRVAAHAQGKTSLIAWHPVELKGESLLNL
jgi:arsenite-transporting ATPase